MGCSIVWYGFLFLVGILFFPPLVIAYGTHKIINNIFTPAKSVIIAGYVIGAVMTLLHWASLNDDDTFMVFLPTVVTAVFCGIVIIYYANKKKKIKDALSDKTSGYVYKDSFNHGEFHKEETVDETIERLINEVGDYLDKWTLNYANYCDIAAKAERKSNYDNLSKSLKECYLRSDDIMQEIELRFKKVFELVKSEDASDWSEISVLHEHFSEAHESQIGVLENAYNTRKMFADNQHALKDCDDAIAAQKRVLARIEWVLRGLVNTK